MPQADLMITLPATIKWSDYQEELDAVRDGALVMNFRLPSLPKQSGPGARCYTVHRGHVVGWMEITELAQRPGFTCQTTGHVWAPGAYVTRSGTFHRLETLLPQKGFQGYRYAPDTWRELPCR